MSLRLSVDFVRAAELAEFFQFQTALHGPLVFGRRIILVLALGA